MEKAPQRGEEKQKQPGESEQQGLRDISIVLDNYDDIFSDFDPRPYSQRELSEDFIKELSRRYLEDSKGKFEVRFLIPAYERDPKGEAVIKKRLREHFLREERTVAEEIRIVRGRGLAFIAVGITLLLAEAFIAISYKDSVVVAVIGILFLPAGWFGVWTGIEKLLDTGPRILQQKAAHEKFSKCNYIFISDDRE